MGQLTDGELERIRRSIAMLTPRQPSGMSRELAIEIIEELQRCRCGWRRVTEALREILTSTQRALGRRG